MAAERAVGYASIDSERRLRSNSCPSSCSTISGTPATSAASPTKH